MLLLFVKVCAVVCSVFTTGCSEPVALVSQQTQPLFNPPASDMQLPPEFTLSTCQDDRANLNESCSLTSECITGLLCSKAGVCVCREGTVETLRPLGQLGLQPYCQPMPTYGQQCGAAQCVEPLACRNGRCQCPSGLIRRNGYCFRDCAEDEYFLKKKGVCRKRCSDIEVKIDEECLLSVGLTDECFDSRQCNVAYSECKSTRCQCMSGFKHSNGACVPFVRSCPVYSAQRDSQNNIVLCQRMRVRETDIHLLVEEQTQEPLEDSCASGYFCQPDGPSGTDVEYGHCCPKPPRIRCPVGSPHPKASCLAVDRDRPFCPHDTHYCYGRRTGAHAETPLCCAKPCGALLLVDGLCVPPLNFGDACLVDEQCRNHFGRCLDGRCQCPPNGRVQIDGVYRECYITCARHLYVSGVECRPRQKLGDVCATDSRCPFGSRCKKGRCECECGRKPVGRDYCLPQAQCPSLKISRLMVDVAKPVYCQTVQSNEGAADGLNLTVVRSCAAGTYCYDTDYRLDNLGVCCPVPPATCPNGAAQIGECIGSRGSGNCAGGYCHRYYFPSNAGSSSQGFVCCALPGSASLPLPIG